MCAKGRMVRPTPAQAFKRAVVKTFMWAFGFIFFIGTMTGDRLGMYDRLVGTEVVVSTRGRGGFCAQLGFTLMTSLCVTMCVLLPLYVFML